MWRRWCAFAALRASFGLPIASSSNDLRMICTKCVHSTQAHDVTSGFSSSWIGRINPLHNESETLLQHVCIGCTDFVDVVPDDVPSHLRQGHWSMICGKCGEWPFGSRRFTCKDCTENPTSAGYLCHVWRAPWCAPVEAGGAAGAS